MATLFTILLIFIIIALYYVLFKLLGKKGHLIPELLWYNHRIQANVRGKLKRRIKYNRVRICLLITVILGDQEAQADQEFFPRVIQFFVIPAKSGMTNACYYFQRPFSGKLNSSGIFLMQLLHHCDMIFLKDPGRFRQVYTERAMTLQRG